MIGIIVVSFISCKYEVTTDTNPEGTFSEYKTFEMCLSPEEESVVGVYNTHETREAIERGIIDAMQDQGFDMTGEGADVFVNYHISSQPETYTLVNCSHDDGEQGYWPSCKLEEFTFTQGSLTIHMIDNATGSIVWIGTADGILDGVDPEDMPKILQEVVKEIFEEYPGIATII